jgi:cathepsin D
MSLFLVAVALLPFILAAPQPDAGAIHVPIVRRNQPDRVANLPKVVQALRSKYGFRPIIKDGYTTLMKRANSVAIPLSDEVCKAWSSA